MTSGQSSAVNIVHSKAPFQPCHHCLAASSVANVAAAAAPLIVIQVCTSGVHQCWLDMSDSLVADWEQEHTLHALV